MDKNLINEKLKQKTTSINTSYYALIAVLGLILFYLGVFTRFTTDYPTHTNSMGKLAISSLLNPLNWPSCFSTIGYPLWFLCGKIIMKIFSCPPIYAVECVQDFLGLFHIWEYCYFLNIKTVIR